MDKPQGGNAFSIVRSSLECGLGCASITSLARISHLSWPLAVVYFKADPRLMTPCTGLENSHMMVPCMFAKGSLDVATVSTPSAGYGKINRMACVHMRG